jgi:hypothetical protein
MIHGCTWYPRLEVSLSRWPGCLDSNGPWCLISAQPSWLVGSSHGFPHGYLLGQRTWTDGKTAHHRQQPTGQLLRVAWSLAGRAPLERQATNALGEMEQEVRYGITSLPTSVGTPQRLLALVREHWGIENGLHYRRDRTFQEDLSPLRMGHAPHLLAFLNNTALGLVRRRGKTNLPQAQHTFDYQFDRALARMMVV